MFLSASDASSLPHLLLVLCFFLLCLRFPLDTSTQQDWCYLNEDGELGLAYQGLKQVARSLISIWLFYCRSITLPPFLENLFRHVSAQWYFTPVYSLTLLNGGVVSTIPQKSMGAFV